MFYMKVTNEQNQYFADIAEEIVCHEEYQKLKDFTHHLCMSRYEHCMHVAYRAYVKAVCSKKEVDLKSLIRGALLHDFYFYTREEAPKGHLKSHPLKAIENVTKFFDVNEIEKDIIVTHMWPIGGRKPKFIESNLVMKSDKVSAFAEVIKIKQTFLNDLRILLEQYKIA